MKVNYDRRKKTWSIAIVKKLETLRKAGFIRTKFKKIKNNWNKLLIIVDVITKQEGLI